MDSIIHKAAGLASRSQYTKLPASHTVDSILDAVSHRLMGSIHKADSLAQQTG
jgi:hypothetical protein